MKQPPPPANGFDTRRHLLIAGAVFVVAFGLRLLFLLSAVDRSWPHSVNYEGDAVIWAQAADLFARGDAPDEGVPHRFYAIAYILEWLGPGTASPTRFVAFKAAWCALSALACAIGYLVFVRNLPRRRAAVIATALCTLSFGSYVLATSLNVEGLYAPILMLILGGTLELVRRPTWGRVAGLALLHGVALLTREEHVVLLMLLGAYTLWCWTSRFSRGDAGGARRGATVARAVPLARRLTFVGAITVGAIALCLPYSVHATRATIRYNTVPRRPPEYERTGVVWSPEARSFIDGLPAFLRAKIVAMASEHARRQQPLEAVTADSLRQLLAESFGGVPEPLSTPVFIASHGPMSFALSNHPASNGGFSRAALETPSHPRDPRLNLTLPEHLRIFNHGYAAGWGYIVSDPPRWLSNVLRKLAHAYQGASLGFTAYNLPLGRFGERRACDLLTPLPDMGATLWQVLFGAMLIVGAAVAGKLAAGRMFLLVIAYKVVIVVVYYGYARQTASILPAFLVVAALGIDGLLDRLDRGLSSWFGRAGRPARAGRPQLATALVACLVVAGVEIHAATHPPGYSIVGAVRPLPQWGPGAFSANSSIEVRAESQ